MKTPFLLNRENEAGVGLKVSPNTGTNVYYYDSAGNLIKRVAATSAVTQYTYDAQDRVLTMTFPAESKVYIGPVGRLINYIQGLATGAPLQCLQQRVEETHKQWITAQENWAATLAREAKDELYQANRPLSDYPTWPPN